MKKTITFLSIFCLVAMVLVLPIKTSAAVIHKGKIEIATINANTGDTVVIPVYFKENPGIIAVSIDFTYDPSDLKYIGFSKGDVLKVPSINLKSGSEKIRLVTLETADRTNSGTLISLHFEVKSTAEKGLSPVSVKYSSGDFCNWNEDRIMPTVVSGGVNIAYNGSNCSHKTYGEWQKVAEPTCQSTGIQQRACKECGHLEQAEIEKIGHKFAEDWTVLTPATKDTKGIAVRYCLFCDAYTNQREFSLQQSEDAGFENSENAIIPEEEGKDFTKIESDDIIGKYDNMIEDLAPQYNTYGDMTVLEKIAEYFPSLDKILAFFEAILIALWEIVFI